MYADIIIKNGRCVTMCGDGGADWGRQAPLKDAPVRLPPVGSAVLNDTPVACQTRGPTDPQGDRWRAAPDEVSLVLTAAAELPPREFICCTPSHAAL